MCKGRKDERGAAREDTTPDVMKQLCGNEDREMLEVVLQRQQKLASLGLLVGSIAHEINNPLTAVMNYAQAIADSVSMSRAAHAYSAEILKNSAWIAALVQNMLAFVREGPRRADPANVLDIVNASLSLIGSLLRKRDVEIRVSCPPDLPLVVCRAQEIQQALINLLTNACDALNAKYPAHDPNKIISVSLKQVMADGRNWVRTTVEDRGNGMTPDVQRKAFSPLFTVKEGSGGVGLGLWVCQHIARSHQGRLWIESEAGQFTRFHLDLRVEGEAMKRQVHLLRRPKRASEGSGRATDAKRREDERRAAS